MYNSWAYDARHLITEVSYEVDIVLNQSHDAGNRLVEADGSYSKIEYRYDALGRRIARDQSNNQEILLWWGNTEQSEHKHQAGQVTIQNDLQANPSEQALNTMFARTLEGNKQDIQYFHKNYLDHVVAVSNDNGNLIEHYPYTAFGESEIYNNLGQKLAASAIDNDILWNVRRYEQDTGLYMYLYRHYDAASGRWPSRDPIGERGGVNLYAFVGNDGVNAWDLLGLHLGIGPNIPCNQIDQIILDAQLARAAYFDDPSGTDDGGGQILPDGWTRAGRASDPETGFDMSVFSGPNNESVVAFRGTQEGIDWRTNGQQAVGQVGEQYRQAHGSLQRGDAPNATRVVGHSLGGGLAASYGAARGLPTTTFNSAGIHGNTSRMFGNSRNDYQDHVNSVVVKDVVIANQ